ncbi:hypothetical protein BT69DRAFT_117607 [Atractiella rhizophila]|nr:hypothetical protein BT69DRAFT_117607 [Atractiella rhizophila]
MKLFLLQRFQTQLRSKSSDDDTHQRASLCCQFPGKTVSGSSYTISHFSSIMRTRVVSSSLSRNQACLKCRSRKVRCSAERPSCNACRSKSTHYTI